MEDTIKLYNKNAYQTEFDAVVLSCLEVEQKKEKIYQVVLDQTLFFPEEGGQSPDKGLIQNIDVLDVQIKNDVITHTLAKPLSEGDTVSGKIDWVHRFNNMQQHTGEHIFSGLVHSRFGYDNVGFHLSDQIVTMDFSGMITEEEVSELEYAANEVIAKNLPVEVLFPSKEELVSLDYRSKIEIEGQVRLVQIGDVDLCACCAPHVARTGEVGGLKIMSRQNYKGGVRLSLLCGLRALGAFQEKAAILSELTTLLSEKQEGLVDNVTRLLENNQKLKIKLIALQQEQMQNKLTSIPAEQTDVFMFEDEMDAPLMRNAVNQLVKMHSGVCGIFAGNDADGYRFIIGSQSQDTREVLNRIREKAEVRGGGSPAMVQGSVMSERAVWENVLA